MNGNRDIVFSHEIHGDLPLVFTKTRGVEYRVIVARNYAYIELCNRDDNLSFQSRNLSHIILLIVT